MERCPTCKEGVLLYRWYHGCLRMICLNRRCRTVFDAGRTMLGVMAVDDELYEAREGAQER